jgi:hypothetical protein
MSVGFGRMIRDYRSYGAGAKIRLRINKKGEVCRMLMTWKEIVPWRMYPIRTPQEALEDLRNHKGSLGKNNKGKVEKISLRYYTPSQKPGYVGPIYYFDCSGPKGHFYGLVPAIREDFLKSREETLKEYKKRKRGTRPK